MTRDRENYFFLPLMFQRATDKHQKYLNGSDCGVFRLLR